MTDQPSLFDADRTVATTCPVCRAARAAGETKATGCAHDLNPEGRRPTGCLNTVEDPRYAPIPYA